MTATTYRSLPVTITGTIRLHGDCTVEFVPDECNPRWLRTPIEDAADRHAAEVMDALDAMDRAAAVSDREDRRRDGEL